MYKIKPLRCICDLNAFNDLSQVRTVNQQIISLLSTVLERCKKEKECNCLQLPLEDYYERVAFYTAYPKSFIYYMIEGNSFKEQTLDIFDHVLLMECINNLYSKRHLNKFKNLYDEFVTFKSSKPNNYKINCIENSKTFDLKLLHWGYGFKKCSNTVPLLIENQKLKFDRFNYLNKLRNYRQEGRQIYYVDEKRIFNTIMKYSRVSEDGKSQQLQANVYFYMITDRGYENGLFSLHHLDKSFEETFKKWMIDIVLNSIRPSSVVVMENSILHGQLHRKTITRYHSKREMIKWLQEKDIPSDVTMAKPQLYDLIKKCTVNESYEIDGIFKANGHDVLRLPETFTSLTPTTFLWEYLNKKYVLEDNNCEILKEKILHIVTKVTPNLWTEFSAKVIELENDIFKFDAIAEILVDTFELDDRAL